MILKVISSVILVICFYNMVYYPEYYFQWIKVVIIIAVLNYSYISLSNYKLEKLNLYHYYILQKKALIERLQILKSVNNLQGVNDVNNEIKIYNEKLLKIKYYRRTFFYKYFIDERFEQLEPINF